jgi:hypothetical protein
MLLSLTNEVLMTWTTIKTRTGDDLLVALLRPSGGDIDRLNKALDDRWQVVPLVGGGAFISVDLSQLHREGYLVSIGDESFPLTRLGEDEAGVAMIVVLHPSPIPGLQRAELFHRPGASSFDTIDRGAEWTRYVRSFGTEFGPGDHWLAVWERRAGADLPR